MKVAVLDYGMGNLRSVAKALEAAGAEVIVTSDSVDIDRSEALCVPGQGVFGRCVANLAKAGQDDLVRTWIGDERPYLGICLGMQILFERSEEGREGPVEGLGILGGEVRRLTGGVRVPHMGWNQVAGERGGTGGEYYYFDHSYAVFARDEAMVSGWCEHGQTFVAAIDRGPLTAVQFHPEKSGVSGIALLEKWLEAATGGEGR
jgi:glutamine amidotransferase